MRYLLTPSSQMQLGVGWYFDRARDPAFRNDSLGMTLGLLEDWSRGISTGFTARFAKIQYDGLQPLFGEYRNDHFNAFSATISKRDWRLFDFIPTVSVTHFDDRSSIDSYSLNRTQLLFGFNRRL